jgi:hypothetical protein
MPGHDGVRLFAGMTVRAISLVMPGLVPGIHVLLSLSKEDGIAPQLGLARVAHCNAPQVG